MKSVYCRPENNGFYLNLIQKHFPPLKITCPDNDNTQKTDTLLNHNHNTITISNNIIPDIKPVHTKHSWQTYLNRKQIHTLDQL